MSKSRNGVGSLLEILAQSMSKEELIASRCMLQISSVLTDYRVRNGLDQKEFAEKLNVSQPMVSKYESGDYNFTINTLAKIAEQLDLDLDINLKPNEDHIQIFIDSDKDGSEMISTDLKNINPSDFMNLDIHETPSAA
jgi:transcriptional regulator with XRE-family HTH domain